MEVINLNIRELFLAVVRRPNFGWRTFIMFVSIILAVSVYTFIVDFYDPESNIISSLNIFPKKQEIFSGSPGGFYITLGTEISNELEKSGYSINLKNRFTAGGYENAINVLVTPNSYGLIQEDTIKNSDFIRDHVNYITPLYMERMHVLYRYDKAKEYSGLKEPDVKISSNLNGETRKYFSKAVVSTGPVGGSGRIITSYIINHINKGLQNNKDDDSKSSKTYAYSTMNGLSELKNGNVDVVFLLSGAPVKSVRDTLKYKKNGADIRLMSIEPSVVADLNKDYGLNLRMSDFKRKYIDTLQSKNISTLGSYAFLIASKDVSSSDIMEFVGALHNIKSGIKKSIGLIGGEEEEFQLDEFNFFESFKSDNSKSFYTTARNFILFLVSVTATTALAVTFLVWVVSGIKQNYYFQKIYLVVDGYMPPPLGLDDNNSHFPVPVVKNNLTEEVSKLVRGLNILMELTKKLHKDYQTGGVTDTHYVFLVKNIALAKNDFRVDLYRRLKVFLERENKIESEDIVKYFLAGFLDSDQHEDLMSRVETMGTRKTI